MRVSCAISALVTTLALALHGADAAASKAGAPERLVARGGECVRLFHSGGDIGCRSLTKGDMAALYPIETEQDLQKWIEDGDRSDRTKKSVLVLPEHLITSAALAKAKERLAGIVMYPDGTTNVSFASQTPQGDGSIDAKLNPFASKKIKWNPTGRGLVDQTLPYPVLQLEDYSLGRTFLDRAKMNVKSHAGATYTAFMNHYYGPETMDSIKCLKFRDVYGNRHPKCDPIGGQSAWGVRGNRSADETIVVMAGMDAYALSQVLVPGANEAASGVVALLAAAKALQVIPDTEFSKQIVFATFQAEKFGFVGSRRFLLDLKKAAKNAKSFCKTAVKDSKSPFASEFCSSPLYPSLEFTKLNPSSFSYAIAVDQVGVLGEKSNFSVHVNPNAPAKAVATLVDTITKAPSAKSKFSKGTVAALPPTPLLSFVNANEYGDKELVSAVIAGYNSQYVGEGMYGSRHDLVGNLNVDAVVQASQVLAETVYQLGAKASSSASLKKIQVDKVLVQGMLECISVDWRCDLMKNYSQPWVNTMMEYLDLLGSAWPTSKFPVSLYSGPLDSDRQATVLKGANSDAYSYVTDFTDAWSDDANRVNLFPNAYEVFARAFLGASLADAAATGDKTCMKTQDCEEKGLECVYPGICAKQRAHFHDAYSPGINRTASLKVYDVVDEKMPLWTEPSWEGDVGSYVFPNPGNWIGWVALLIGLAVSGVGFFASRWLLSSVHKMKLL